MSDWLHLKKTSLSYKLGLSYVLVTTSALLVVQVLLLAGISWWQRNNCLLWRWMAPALQEQLANRVDSTAPQAWLQTWVESGVVRSSYYGLDLTFSLSSSDFQQVYLLNDSGKPLAWLPPQEDPGATLPAFLNGLDMREEQPQITKDRNGCLVAIPLQVQAQQNWLIFRYAMPYTAAAFWSDALRSVLPSMFIILPLTALIGFTFGLFASKPLIRRLRSIITASEAWSRGRFTETIPEQSDDEIGALARHLNQMAEQLQNLLHTRQELAALQERNRLARDLHDSVKQQLFAASMQTATARQLLRSAPDDAVRALRATEAILAQTRQELATLIRELRPGNDLSDHLPDSLQTYVAAWQQQTGIRVEWAATEVPPITSPIAREIQRILQEALSNVARHSGATRVQIALESKENGLRLSINDNGKGFDVQQGYQRGVGLSSMEERTRLLGGAFRVQSKAGQGTRLDIWFPVKGENGL